MEAQRASNGLVKVMSGKIGSSSDQVQKTASSCISPLAEVWFPAHWAVRVKTRLCSLGETASEYRTAWEMTRQTKPEVQTSAMFASQDLICSKRSFPFQLNSGWFEATPKGYVGVRGRETEVEKVHFLHQWHFTFDSWFNLTLELVSLFHVTNFNCYRVRLGWIETDGVHAIEEVDSIHARHP